MFGQVLYSYLECHFTCQFCLMLGNFTSYFSAPSSPTSCPLAPTSFFHFQHTPASLCPGALCATTVLWLGSSGSQLSTKIYICTSEAFDGRSRCGGASPVSSSTLTGTACAILCRLAGNPSAFPVGRYFPWLSWSSSCLFCCCLGSLISFQVRYYY